MYALPLPAFGDTSDRAEARAFGGSVAARYRTVLDAASGITDARKNGTYALS